MEVEIAKQIFSEGGMIYGLFFIIVGGFIWKGVPYIANKFEEVIKAFTMTLQKQQATFENSLEKISEDFVKQIEKSNTWHEKHSQQLDEIKLLLTNKK